MCYELIIAALYLAAIFLINYEPRDGDRVRGALNQHIDPNGVIQFKWVGYPGAKAIDEALDKQFKEAEGKAKTAP